MLLLTSNGLSSQALLNCVQSNMNNGKSAVLITTASAPFKRNDRHIPRLTVELESIAYSVDFFDFDEDDPKELFKYDLIEIIGGNPFLLLRSIRRAGAELILKQLAKEKILIGISAGSVVLQNSIRLIANIRQKADENRIKEIIQFVGLKYDDKRKYKQFSLGMKQRLGIAAAVLEKPELLLIDEPTNALDSDGVEMLKNLVRSEKERGALIILACHDFSVLSDLSDEIYFIEEGRVRLYDKL